MTQDMDLSAQDALPRFIMRTSRRHGIGCRVGKQTLWKTGKDGKKICINTWKDMTGIHRRYSFWLFQTWMTWKSLQRHWPHVATMSCPGRVPSTKPDGTLMAFHSVALVVYTLQRACQSVHDSARYTPTDSDRSCFSSKCSICMYVINTYIYIYVYIYMYVCMYECVYVRMYVCTYVRMYVRTYVCMYVCMHACIYACMYVVYDICILYI